MSSILKTLVAAAALLPAAPAAAAQPDLARYDARAAQSLEQQLVLCDLASYFESDPNLEARLVFVRRDVNRFEATIPAAITRAGEWHDGDLEGAFLRHRSAGRVSSAQVDALRRQYGVEMEDAFRDPTLREQRFFQSQGRFCRELVRAAWR